MKYPVELIEWLDHASLDGDRGWRTLTEAEELVPVTVFTVGWAIKESDQFVVMVSQVGGEQIDGEICILKSCISRRVVLLKDPGL